MFKNFFKIIGAGLFCVLLTISCASEGPKKPAIEQGDLEKARSFYTAYVEHQARTQGAMGLAVLVVDRDGILYNQGFGSQNPEKNIKFSTETISNVGSVSKLFTCLAVLTLVDKGQIDLDAPITTYIPEFKIKSRGENTSKITARNLLTHHAGIINDELSDFGTNDPEVRLQKDFRSVPRLIGETYMAEEPGALMSYSNLGYSLLGNIVERVSKENFETYVDNHVLKPLGMNDSSFESQVSKIDRIAKGRAQNYQLVEISRIRDIPAGSLTTTSSDMAKFLVFALNHGQVGQTRLISEKTFDEMWSRQNGTTVLDFDFSIGLTWWQTVYDSLPSETLFGHGGDLDSFHAMLQVDDKRGLAIFVMTNAIDGNSFSLDQIVFEGLRTFVKVQDGIDLAPKAAKSTIEVAFDQKLAGIYATQMGMMQVDVQGTTAKVDFLGNALEGIQYEDGHIKLKAKVLGIELDIPFLKSLSLEVKLVNGQTYLLTKMDGMLFGLCTKITASPIDAIWKTRLGQWVKQDKTESSMFEELELDLDSKTGLFVVRIAYGGSASYPVRIVNDRELVTEGHGRNLGATLFVERGTDGKEVLNFFGIKMIKR